MFNDKTIPLKYKIFLIIFLIIFGMVLYCIKYTGYYTIPEQQTYSEELVSFLTTSYRLYNDTDSEDMRQMIRDNVRTTYPNLNKDVMSNENIRQFYIECLE